MPEFWRNIFYAFVAETFVALTAWIVKEDKRKQTLVLVFGTTVAGIIAFGPSIMQTVSAFVTSTSIDSPNTAVQPTSQALPTQETKSLVATKPDFITVPITSIANHPMDNIASPLSGEYVFNSIPFTFLSGSKAVFQSQHHLLTTYPTHASLGVSISRPLSVYVLINGAYVYKHLEGQIVGKIILNFDSQEPLATNLIAGENLRENWAYTSDPTPWSGEDEVITTIANPTNWQNVYKESQSRDGKPALGYIDLVTIPLPDSYQTTKLVQIDIQDDSYDPSLVVYGITVMFAK